MSSLFGVPVDAAYHLVSLFAAGLTPVLGGFAAAAAIVAFTLAVRLVLLPLSYRATRGLNNQAKIAPAVAALRKKHAGQPDVLQRELTALYQAEGTSVFAGCLPLLVQWPFLSVMYLLFRSPVIDGAPNGLLHHELFGAALGGHWLSGAGLLSVQGAVFAGVLVLLSVLCWLTVRAGRRLSTQAAGAAAAARAGSGSGGGVAGAGAIAALVPYVTVVFAAFLPLAAGIYLVTTTAWTLGERAVFGRRLLTAGGPGAAQGRHPGRKPA
jgi:YidC/Oxa1 family membrane protein insertase